ncbi:CotH kinase family protein [Streptomyces sp. CRN 30]|uniref:CotH kinase family protein n=1 Tax=Streptomyces sp. CRN 30 TaxID=3075613 RepID=UPI002A834E69|nr:CotH kinase family protein [Streptomyces sp. CRN 30]
MDRIIDKGTFRDAFKNQAVAVSALPAGAGRRLAERANAAAGPSDAVLRTKAEFSAVYDLLLAEQAGQGDVPDTTAPGVLVRAGADGQLTAVGRMVDEYLGAAEDKAEFFAGDMYQVRVTGWPAGVLTADEVTVAPDGARLTLARSGSSDSLLSTGAFSMVNSGNLTAHAPKRSWKIDFEVGTSEDRLYGMERVNLKAMYNDPSQMREAVAWRLLERAGIPASQHTYATFSIDDRYMGLFSVIEQVDKKFLKDHFGKNSEGNLYKAYCGDIGCATLEHRTGKDGDDSGRQYFTPGSGADDRTYRLKTNEDDPSASTYDDLAELVRAVNGVRLAGGADRFGTDAFRESVESVLNVRAFLRWAGANVLLGSWDNYFATPSNYYLYNSGRLGDPGGFMSRPYFTFVPWDYDNSSGIDFFSTPWQYTDLLDWPEATRAYCRINHAPHAVSQLPLLTNLLRHHDFCQYYLDHLEHLLDTEFGPERVAALLGAEGSGRSDGLWQLVSSAAYGESTTPDGRPFTGRQFTNDEVYRAGYRQWELGRGSQFTYGIYHYTRMRYDRAREQLAELRKTYPDGASGAVFPGAEEVLPS